MRVTRIEGMVKGTVEGSLMNDCQQEEDQQLVLVLMLEAVRNVFFSASIIRGRFLSA